MHDGILANHLLFRRMHNKKRMFKQKPQSDSGKFLRSSRHVIFANRSSSTNFEAAKTDTDIANHMKINIQQRKVSLSIFIKPKRRRRWGSAQKKKLTKQFVIERLFNIDCISAYRWVFLCVHVWFVSSTMMIETC